MDENDYLTVELPNKAATAVSEPDGGKHQARAK